MTKNNFYNINGVEPKIVYMERKDYTGLKNELDYLKHVYKIKTNELLDVVCVSNLNTKELVEELRSIREKINQLENDLFFIIEN